MIEAARSLAIPRLLQLLAAVQAPMDVAQWRDQPQVRMDVPTPARQVFSPARLPDAGDVLANPACAPSNALAGRTSLPGSVPDDGPIAQAGGTFDTSSRRLPAEGLPSWQDALRDAGAATPFGQLAGTCIGASVGMGADRPHDGFALEGFHWRAAPPDLLAALQEGGRERMASLRPLAA